MNRIDLEGRRAVVTGGARGIGLAITERCLASGASVAIWDVDESEGRAVADRLAGSGSVSFQKVDVTDLASVEAGVAETIETLGGLDIMVANAGIAGPAVPIADYPPEMWDQVIAIDLTGVFYCLRAVVPHMTAQNYGRIVATSSVAGKEGNPNAGPYSAAKAGVMALVKSLAKELASHDIAVNCITPATAPTKILEQISQEHIEYMRSKIPRGRFVEVTEIASMVAWLVSEENSFTTGSAFDLSGGRTTY